MVSSRTKPGADLLALHHDPEYVDHSTLLRADGFPAGVDTVVHMAALNEWDCVARPSEAIAVNIDQTRIILENAIQKGVANFYYFSTAHIYGSPLQGLITETSLPAPQHPYAITHRAAEDYVLAAARKQQINAKVLRLSNSFGAPVNPYVNRWTLLANDLARQAIEKKQLTLLSNGCQYRDFITLEDVEEVMVHLINAAFNQWAAPIYNLSSASSMRVIDMAEKIAGVYKELTGSTIKIVLPSTAKPTVEPQLIISNELLRSTGVKLTNDIDMELKNLLQFCLSNFVYQETIGQY
jgi:UDP-glucose 4-epimerase